MSLGLGLNLNITKSPGVSIPFDFDSNTYWWDFNASANTVETEGDDTISVMRERIRGEQNFIQPTKDYQPLDEASGGDFNQDTPREMFLEDTAGIANGTDGYYFGCNLRFDTVESGIFLISRNSSDVGSRGDIYVTGARNFRLLGNTSDSATNPSIVLSAALTIGTWYTLEVLWDLDTEAVVYTTPSGGSTTAVTASGAQSPTTFPASDPFQVVIGNRANESSSMDGNYQQAIFHNTVPSTALRENFQSYLISQIP